MSKFYDYFPGGNTSKGFYSFYRYIMPQSNATRIFCLKGGPGTGKSSLMKKVSNYFAEKGYDIEYHHCSSDNNSLDGIVIKGLNVVLLDGTAPHVVDPINPGAVDEILNMGECWNADGFKESHDNIIDCNKRVGNLFKAAYRYIGAAKLVHDDISTMNSSCLSLNKVNVLQANLANKIFTTPVSNLGNERHMFATALTPNGVITYIENLIQDMENVYVLKGGPGLGRNEILEYLSQEAIRHGYYVEIFHTPLKPERLEHIIIPELKTAIVSSNELTKIEFNGTIINLEDNLNPYIADYSAKIEKANEYFWNLLSTGLSYIKEAKGNHDLLENYYIPNMDFDKMNKIYDYVINRIEAYEK